MKLTFITFAILLAQHACAQDTAHFRLVCSISGGAFLPRHPGENFIESFSYTSTPTATGISSTQQFTGSVGGDFAPVAYVGDIMNIEVTSHRHSINGGVGLFFTGRSDDGGYFKGGYSRVIRFHRSRFRFQPGVDCYGVLGSHIELGRIDNRAQTLQVLGYTAKPQWTTTSSDRSGTHTHTYTSDHLSVQYRRNALLLEPNVGLSATLGEFVLGLQAGWMLQLSQTCRLLLQQQDNSGDRNTIAKVHEPRNGSLNGLYTSLRVGFINRSRHMFSR